MKLGEMLVRDGRLNEAQLDGALKYQARDGGRIGAIEDPHDFATLEALNQITGYRVLPRVAPEVRIYYYIERYYGVARPPRFMKFGDTPRGSDTVADAGL